MRDTISKLEATGSPVIADGEQRKYHNFWTYSLAGEPDHEYVLKLIRDRIKPHHKIFVGVVSPIDLRVETPEEVRDRVLEAAQELGLSNVA